MKISRKKPGYVLATVVILMGVTIFGVGTVITVSSLESKISRSNQEGTRAYYAAESGVEDALWRVKNTASYTTGLAAGNLNVTYCSTTCPTGTNLLSIKRDSTDKPGAGQGFKVTIVSTSAGNATVTVYGYSDNGSFRAQRKVETNVFVGQSNAGTIGSASIATGGMLDISNGAANVNISGGEIYANGKPGKPGVNLKNVNISLNGGGGVYTPSSYSASNSNVNASGGIHASNYPPAATARSMPGVDFTSYATSNTVSYTPTQFQNAIKNSGGTINFNGPITYVSGDVNLTSTVAQNKTINVKGLLVINGSLTIGSNLNMNFIMTSSSDGKAAVLIRTNFTSNGGNYNLSGVVYSSGTMTFSGAQNFNMQGALIAGDTISINASVNFSLNYSASSVTSVFGSSSPQPIEIKHWEEVY